MSRPHIHLLIAVVPVILYVLLRYRALPSLALVYVAFFGSQFPDLVDKPLATELLLIPNGRMFTHSLMIAVPVSIGVILFVRRRGYLREGAAFVFAYLSHIVADFHRQLLQQNPTVHPNMLWPLSEVREHHIPFWAGPGDMYVHLWTAFSIVVLLLTAYLIKTELDAHATVS
ncbi:metal-dependent hydrolase [Salinigranum sp. GCM10025319]|uniref:metal-dependent hydrolase n=1 Tax=Salinigranum sp. GCM10025319 TaxID=3252687 RepID=UPI003613BD31